jgi:hypothetical protein
MRRGCFRFRWLCLLHFAVALPSQSCHSPDSAPPAAHSVSYQLEWRRRGGVDPPSDAPLEITNDLGYLVRVTRGYVVTRSIEMIPCAIPSPVSLLDTIDRMIGPRPAFAGHSAIPDPSSTKSPTVESLLQRGPRQLPALYPGARMYCRAHYLIARADPQSAGLPTEIDMVDQTLRVEGTFQRRGEATATPFTVTSAVANGKLFELGTQSPSAAARRLDTTSESAIVIVRRNLDTIFDRVDFATMNEKRMAREMLQNLVDGAELEVRVVREGK